MLALDSLNRLVDAEILAIQTFNNLSKQMSVSSMTVGGKIKYKLVLLGDQFVGKSSVIERFINNRFEETYNATIGIDFLVRNLTHDNKTYRLQLWDTAGQERFRALIPSYLKDSHCALIVYDLSNSKTLDNAIGWLDFYKQHKEPHSVIVLVGNKSDASVEPKGCRDDQIDRQAHKQGVPSYKISAKTGQGVNELFLKVIQLINYSLNNQAKSLLSGKIEEEEEAGTSSVVQNIPVRLETDARVVEGRPPCC